VAGLEYLRRKAVLEASIDRLRNLVPGSDPYDRLYFSEVYPWVIELVRQAFAGILEREGISEYAVLVMPLSFYAEPHVLMANAIAPRQKLVLFVDGSETTESLQRVLTHLEGDLAARTEVLDLARYEQAGLAEMLCSLTGSACGRILVDVTGHKKSTAVRLTMAAMRMESVDLAYLDGRGIKDHIPGSAAPRPGTERILFWSGRDRREAREQSVSLVENECITVSSRGGTAFAVRVRKGISHIEAVVPRAPLEPILARIGNPACSRSELLACGHRFHEHLIPPELRAEIGLALSGRDITFVCSDQDAADLPFEFLVHQGSFLGEQTPVRRILPADTPGSGRSRAVTTRRMLILEGAGPGGWYPAATREVRDLAALAQSFGIPVTVMRGAFIEEVLLQARQHGILHYVGHGDTRGVFLADGILEPGVVEGLTGMAGFVFLNACESGSSRMAGAMLAAGTQTCIGARQVIRDGLASQGVIAMYRRLFETADVLAAAMELVTEDAVVPYRIWGSRWLGREDTRGEPSG